MKWEAIELARKWFLSQWRAGPSLADLGRRKRGKWRKDLGHVYCGFTVTAIVEDPRFLS